MSIEDFYSKVEWEGGFYEAALYGISHKDLHDQTLAKLWQEYLGLAALLERKEDAIREYLNQNGVEEA